MASADAGSSPPVLIDKKNARSVVWQYFGFEPNEHGQPKDTSKPRCKRCNRIVPSKGANTSNLTSHLQDRHKDLYKEFREVCTINESLKSAREASSLNVFVLLLLIAVIAKANCSAHPF